MREYWDLDRTYRGNIDPPYRAKLVAAGGVVEQFSSLVKSAQRFDGDLPTRRWRLLAASHATYPMGVYDAFDVYDAADAYTGG